MNNEKETFELKTFLNDATKNLMKLNEFISKTFVVMSALIIAGLLSYGEYYVDFDYLTLDMLIIVVLLFVISIQVYSLSRMVNDLKFEDMILVTATFVSINLLFVAIPTIGSEYGTPVVFYMLSDICSNVMEPYVMYLLGFGVVKSILERYIY